MFICLLGKLFFESDVNDLGLFPKTGCVIGVAEISGYTLWDSGQ